jgi:hypothetical protein
MGDGMTAVAGASPANAVGRTSHVDAALSAGPAVLLRPPAPDFGGLAGLQDALSVLYADRLEQGKRDVRAVDVQARQQQRATDVEQKKLTTAIAEQRKAERESKGFWADVKKVASTVAKIATVVASAAAIIMSGGAGAPLVLGVAALALSAGGMAVRELKLLGKDSESVGMGMELAGAAAGAAGAAAGAINAGATASAKATTAAQTIKTGAQVTGAAATGLSATAKVVVAGYVRDSELAAADIEEARGLIAQHQRETRFLIDSLEAAKEAERDALAGTMSAIEACNNATAVAISGVRG